MNIHFSTILRWKTSNQTVYKKTRKINQRKPSHASCNNKESLLKWPHKMFWLVLRDCPDLRFLLSLFKYSFHSLTPISNFSKCASITCWTEQREIFSLPFPMSSILCFEYVQCLTPTIPVTHCYGHVHCIEPRIWLYSRVSAALWKTNGDTRTLLT